MTSRRYPGAAMILFGWIAELGTAERLLRVNGKSEMG